MVVATLSGRGDKDLFNFVRAFNDESFRDFLKDEYQRYENLKTLLANRNGKPLFMTHMIAGYPTAQTSEKIAAALVRGGADIIELQIPFSDPMADGPTIMAACDVALRQGMTVSRALAILRSISKCGAPIVVMSYINPVFHFGIQKFVKAIASAGASALIIPDCPFDSEEGKALLVACKKHDIYLIPVVSPGIPKERLSILSKDSTGFVYCTSRRGTTGGHGAFSDELFRFVSELKTIFNLPIAVGFGVKTKADVHILSQHAEIIIAGSVFIQKIQSSILREAPEAVETLARSIK